jgi:hypothetical protein
MKKSYLSILNSNQDLDNLRFLVFITVYCCLMIFKDENLTVHILMQMESKCVGIFSLPLIVHEIRAFNFFNSAQQHCTSNDLRWKIQDFMTSRS